MRSYKYKILLILPAILWLCGCMDDLTTPNNQLNGTVYDLKGEEYASYWTKISCGEYPIIYTYNTSGFRIDPISNPYNLHVSFPSDSTNLKEPSNYIFKGLATTRLNVINVKQIDQNALQLRNIHVLFPDIKKEQKVLCKLICSDYFIEGGALHYIDTVHKQARIPYRNSFGSLYRTGKVYVLELNDNPKNNDDYGRFGIKDVILDNFTDTVIFTNNDMYDVPEVRSNLNVSVPPGINARTYVYLSGPDFNSSSELNLRAYNNNITEIYLPVLPTKDISIKVKSTHRTGYTILPGNMGEKYVYVTPGEDISIVHDEHLNIVYPGHSQENVPQNAGLEFTDNSGPGIYVHEILSIATMKITQLITAGKELNFSEFFSEDFPFIPGGVYVWNIKKYFGYSSMDDFVSGIYINDKKFSAMATSVAFRTVNMKPLKP